MSISREKEVRIRRLRRPRAACSLLLALASFAAGQPASFAAKKYDFDADPIGATPSGFEFARTGRGAKGQWLVKTDEDRSTNHVLVQLSADPTDYRFPLAIAKEGTWKDVALSVRARPVSGKVDQAFGLVWRYQNEDNYYIARCNADEDNCAIYHVVRGSRRPFQSRNVRVASKTWHDLKVEAIGDHFTVWYDGQKVLDAKDRTFQDAGRVGLWTKADSVVQFDDLSIEGR